jgi:hypothetical protein
MNSNTPLKPTYDLGSPDQFNHVKIGKQKERTYFHSKYVRSLFLIIELILHFDRINFYYLCI